MISTMYAIYQIAHDMNREHARDAKISRLLAKARKAEQKRDK